MTGWSLDPVVLLGVALAGGGYAVGRRRLGRAAPGPGRAAAFWGGLLAVLVALVSPLERMATELLSAHMVQHLLLVMVAAPLLVAGLPRVPLTVALPATLRRPLHRTGRRPPLRAVRRAVTHPVVAWVLATAVLWAWHAPALYQAALRDDLVHALEHATLFGTALLFWWEVLDPRARDRLDPGGGLVYLFAAGLQGGALGALFTFAPSPIYPAYAATAPGWGLTAVADQQLAGLIMWIPFGTIYLGVAAARFVGWLRTSEAMAGAASR
ncbi:MAG TPA: cytochrome c oxidase assembly protein [Actinomycetota bacterium]|nr:cytochrome c oxidase assembly protein [Actinomycetota bacterium]